MPHRPKRPDTLFSFDKEHGTYRRRSTGQFVSRREIRSVIDKAIEKQERSLQRLAQKLQQGTYDLARWQNESADVLKELHLWNGAAGRGGWGEMTQSDYGRVGARLREQYGFLDNFAQQLERGEQRLAGTGFLQRVGMYAQAGRNTYEAVLNNTMRDSQFTQESNQLAEAEHCAGCLEATAQGWVPIGTLTLPGERDCLTRCKCEIIYR